MKRYLSGKQYLCILMRIGHDFLSCVLSFYLSLGPYLFWDRYLFKKRESMNNEMISQLQFDRIKKEIQARAIGNYSKNESAI